MLIGLLMLLFLIKALLWAWLVAFLVIFFRESGRADRGVSDLIPKGELLGMQLITCALVPPFSTIWFLDELHRRWKACPELEARLRDLGHPTY